MSKPLPPFEQPTPYSIVMWRAAPGLQASPAIVTWVHKKTLSVTVFEVDQRVGMPKDGVRYVDDPSTQKISPDEGGIWEYTADQLMLREILGLNLASKGK